jgi:hypothetical protein
VTPISMLRYWVRERRAIRERRARGDPWPWSKDPIFQRYRFCNESRRYDKMTVALTAELEGVSINKALLIITAYRAFNRANTWEILRPYITDTWNYRAMLAALKRASVYAPLCSGVWMTTGVQVLGYGRPGAPLYETQAEGLRWAYRNLKALRPAGGVAAQWRKFQLIPRVGPFVAHEMVNDLLYLTPYLAGVPDREWVRLGPGAVRGIWRLRGIEFVTTKNNEPRATADDLRYFSKLARDPHLKGLTVHDLEHCLCEFDKYARAKEGGQLKNRYHYKGA